MLLDFELSTCPCAVLQEEQCCILPRDIKNKRGPAAVCILSHVEGRNELPGQLQQRSVLKWFDYDLGVANSVCAPYMEQTGVACGICM